jgi:hypothetical protein
MSEEQDHERVPSIGELDASLDAYWASHGRPSLLMGDGKTDDAPAGRRLPLQYVNGLNSHPLPNLYPIYPVRGHDVSDLRCNVGIPPPSPLGMALTLTSHSRNRALLLSACV